MNDIKIKVLGSVSPYCKGNKNCPGYLINYGDQNILLDAGNGITREMNLPTDLQNLSIFISHLHKDHYADLFSIAYASYIYRNILKRKINLYIPSVINGDFKTLEYGHEFLKNTPGYYDFLNIINTKEHHFNIEEYSEDNTFKINDLNISFRENKHNIASYYTKLENKDTKIVYSGDSGEGNTLSYFSENADLLICEATFNNKDEMINDNHLSATTAAYIASSANVKKLLLTHFWPETDKNIYLNDALEIFPNTEVAEEGKILKIGGKNGR